MKKILLLLLTLFSFSIDAQNVNYLSEQEFNDIRINGIKWSDIVATNGDGQQMKDLFGNSMGFSEKTEPYPGRSFGNSNGLVFYFEDQNENGEYNVIHMAIYNQEHVLTIKGVDLSIGESILPLKSVITGQLIEIEGENYRRLAFSVSSQNFSLGINYNPDTKTITEIKYTDYN